VTYHTEPAQSLHQDGMFTGGFRKSRGLLVRLGGSLEPTRDVVAAPRLQGGCGGVRLSDRQFLREHSGAR
jgi:hypothetical protein